MTNTAIKQRVSFKKFLLMNLRQKSKICIFFTAAYLLIAVIIASFVPANDVDGNSIKDLIYVTTSLAYIPVLIFVTISFNYLYKRNSEDFFFSLAIRRTKLYWATYLTGFITSVVPVVIYAYTIYLLCVPKGGGLSILEVSGIILKMLLLMICFYSFFVFIAVNTGSIISQLLMSAGSMVVIPAMVLGLVLLAQNTLIGFDMRTLVDNPVFYRLFDALYFIYMGDSFDPVSVLILISIWAVFSLAGWIFFKRRKCESASKWLSFSVLYPLIKIIILVTSIVYTVLLVTGGEHLKINAFVPAAIVGVIVFIVTDMILEKSTRSFYSKKSIITFLIGSGGVLLFCVLLSGGFFGYIDRVPAEYDIEYAGIQMNGEKASLNVYGDYGYQTPENLDRIRKIHLKIIELAKENEKGTGSWREPSHNTWANVSIKYKLKNGFTVERKYYSADRYIEQLAKDIAQTTENTLLEEKILHMNADEIKSILAQNANAYVFEDKNDIRKIFHAIQTDRKNQLNQGRDYKEEKNTLMGVKITLVLQEQYSWRDNNFELPSYGLDGSYPETVKVLEELQLKKKLLENTADSRANSVNVNIEYLVDKKGKKIIKNFGGDPDSSIYDSNNAYSFDGYSIFYLYDHGYIDPLITYCEKNDLSAFNNNPKNCYMVSFDYEISSGTGYYGGSGNTFFIPRDQMPEPVKSMLESVIKNKKI